MTAVATMCATCGKPLDDEAAQEVNGVPMKVTYIDNVGTHHASCWHKPVPCQACISHVYRIETLEKALRDLVMLERTFTPDMSGKRRKWAHMQNGTVLAECLDRAKAILGDDQ